MISTSEAVGLYLHIPFCHAKCGYCDFATYVGQENQIGPYLEALKHELSLYKGNSLQTIFVGGGTPTVLSPSHIENLFHTIGDVFDLSPLTEATIEANPESSTREVLSAYRTAGINRVSFGLQSVNNRFLKELGRLHTFEGFKKAFLLARELGFNNINVDLMFGLPDQTESDWEETLETVLALGPEHLSTYGLKIEAGTEFAKRGIKADDDLEAVMYLRVSEKLTHHGYSHYEISNFAKPGFESRHNLLYWRNAETIGVGLSAASFFRGKRFKNTSHLFPYLEAYKSKRSAVVEETVLDPCAQRNESMMLGLRLKEGIPENQIPEPQEPIFKKFLLNELAFVEQGMYRLTPRGWLLSNQLFQHLI